MDKQHKVTINGSSFADGSFVEVFRDPPKLIHELELVDALKNAISFINTFKRLAEQCTLTKP